MLTREENEFMCRVGPGTPMGELMRQYWIPALMSAELPASDCPPIRLRLLGESLIAFRVTSGGVAVIQNSCPHRGASLFFGRNEEEGLRCVYHGWKYDVTGQCVDMPSEPPESNFKSKVQATAYPSVERNGVIWTYMGPREEPPPLPDLEANMLPDSRYTVHKILRQCNFVQALEGDLDTSHVVFLHRANTRLDNGATADAAAVSFNQRPPIGFAAVDTEFGTCYGAYRPAEADTYYWRLANFLFPFYTMIPTGGFGLTKHFRAWVPVDDENTMFFNVFIPQADQEVTAAPDGRAPITPSNIDGTRWFVGQEYLPDTTAWLGQWRLAANANNDYLVDRESQRLRNFTGINNGGNLLQDQAVTESMGPIYKREREHLGNSDTMIIRTRRRLIQAARDFQEQGILPPGVDSPEVYRYRSGSVILPRSVDWFEATGEVRKAFVEHEASEASVRIVGR